MWVVNCSDYLHQQIAENRWAAYQLMQEQAASQGFWQRLFGWLTGRTRRSAAQRQNKLAAMGVRDRRLIQGQLGEDLLASALSQRLDDRYILLRNYTPPPPFRSGGDIDGVLLGPQGVSMFEVKAWHGVYRCIGDEWLFLPRDRSRWEPAAKNPTQQALRNLQRVQGTLNLAGLNDIQAQPVLAIADAKMRVELQGAPSIPFYRVHEAPDRLDFLPSHTVLSRPQIERVWFALLPQPGGKR
ncbi:MAG: nuclease-related domain-containing protein [Ktedonobacterales bacterium]